MTAIAGLSATNIGAYQREAARLSTPTPAVTAKVVTRDAGFQLGPFSLRYSTTDYEFDLAPTGLSDSFGEALDAAAQAQRLGESIPFASTFRADTYADNALTLRQALTSYQNCQSLPTTAPVAMFSATA